MEKPRLVRPVKKIKIVRPVTIDQCTLQVGEEFEVERTKVRIGGSRTEGYWVRDPRTGAEVLLLRHEVEEVFEKVTG